MAGFSLAANEVQLGVTAYLRTSFLRNRYRGEPSVSTGTVRAASQCSDAAAHADSGKCRVDCSTRHPNRRHNPFGFLTGGWEGHRSINVIRKHRRSGNHPPPPEDPRSLRRCRWMAPITDVGASLVVFG